MTFMQLAHSVDKRVANTSRWAPSLHLSSSPNQTLFPIINYPLAFTSSETSSQSRLCKPTY